MSSRMFSLRLNPDTYAQLAARARQRGESKSRLAERLIDEGLRMDKHPGIVFRDGPAGRRPALAAGPDVWEIIRVVRNADGSAEEVIREAAGYFEFPMSWIRAAVRYYAEYRDEVDRWIRMVDEEAEQAEAAWRREREALAR